MPNSLLRPLAMQAAAALTKYGYASVQAKQAVKAWQQVHGGLALDGIYGPASAKALSADLAPSPAPGAYAQAGGGSSDPAIAQLQRIAAQNKFQVTTLPKGTALTQGFKGLKDSVLAVFPAWNTQFEGALNFMYTDNIGKVTTGIGNLIDPVSAALALPWRRADGSLASSDEVVAAWNTVKAAWPAVQSVNCARLTTLRLDKDGVAQAVDTTLKRNDAMLAGWYPDYAAWPADVQMGAHSMGWAMGLGHLDPTHGDFRSWIAAAKNGDWNAAALASHINDVGNPGLVPRNAANKLLFQNGAKVAAGGGDPDTLYYLDPFVSGLPA